MSSLASLFDKRGNNQKSNLSSLFSTENKKFQHIKQEQVVSNVVYMKPMEEPKKDQPEDLEAAIFVGNVPLNCKQKDLKRLFQQFGSIQKIWFRSIPVEQNKLGKKANFILKKYQQGADSMNGYVKFEQKQSAEAACKMNGHQIEDHTLRVFLCLQDNLDYETTIFIGNLPLELKEEELRAHFKSVGKIVNVRVIRDKQTFKGIGIGYVRFATKQQMVKAIATTNNSVLNGRYLRVKRAIEKSKLQKKFRKLQQKKVNRKGYTAPQNKNKSNKRNKQSLNRDDPQQRRKQNSRKFHLKRKMIKKE